MSYAAWQRLQCAVRFYFRLWKYRTGYRFPDPRNDELRDRGAELEFDARVIRNRRERTRRHEAERIAAKREAWREQISEGATGR